MGILYILMYNCIRDMCCRITGRQSASECPGREVVAQPSAPHPPCLHAYCIPPPPHMQAGRETRAKYLTSYLATKYEVDVEGLAHRPPVNPALQGLRMVPAGTLPKEVALAAGDKQG